MSVFVLKIIALLSMVTDHLSYVLSLAFGMNTPLLYHMRAFGRMAFPIYAFLLVNGFERTRDKGSYMARLFLFALISQIPFSLAFTWQNYKPGMYSDGSIFTFNGTWLADGLMLGFCLAAFFLLIYSPRGKRDFVYTAAALCLSLFQLRLSGLVVLGGLLNVFYTLAVAFALIWALDWLKGPKGWDFSPAAMLMVCACTLLCFCILPRSDYGFKGLLLIAALYLLRDYKWSAPAVIALWSYWMYGYSNVFLLGGLAACVPIIFYNGRLGKKMKYAFYLVYPLHLTALFLVVFFMVKMR